MSRPTDERETPFAFWLSLHDEFAFDLDAAATYGNTLCPRWLGPNSPLPRGLDALDPECHWGTYGRRVWLNPPFSELPKWLDKAEQECQRDPTMTLVILLPADGSTRWFHRYLWDATLHTWRPWVTQVRFPARRLAFGPHTIGAKQPSMLVIHRGDT